VTPHSGQGGGYPPLRSNPDPYGQQRSSGQYPAINANQGYPPPANNPYGTPSGTGTQGAVGGVALTLNEAQRSVGIVGGPNGKGSGLFVTRDGLIATTRYVVGSEESLTIQLASGQTLAGRVLRAFPQFDL